MGKEEMGGAQAAEWCQRTAGFDSTDFQAGSGAGFGMKQIPSKFQAGR